MKFIKFLSLIMLLGLVACSSGSSSDDEYSDSGEEVADLVEDSDFIVDEEGEELAMSDEGGFEEDSMEEVEDIGEPLADATPKESSFVEEPMVMSGGQGEYRVQSGDTLMLIAFKLYGDYRKWKDLSDMNPGVSHMRLSEGQSIKYQEPNQRFVWDPQGLPHLIRRGETLGSISKDKYGTDSRWRDLYTNNQPMIRDPNLIFAGFTLYYVPDRDLASE